MRAETSGSRILLRGRYIEGQAARGALGWGQAPALHFSVSNRGSVHVGHVIVGVLRPYRHLSRIGVRDLLSYQLLIPAVAGTPRYEKLGVPVGGRVGASLLPRAPMPALTLTPALSQGEMAGSDRTHG